MKTSYKHILGLPIGLLVGLYLKNTNSLHWNDLSDSNVFELFFFQSLITIISSFIMACFFEFYQQRNLTEKPSKKDTEIDVIVTTISVYLGYVISYLL